METITGFRKNIQKKEIWRKVKNKISIFEKGLKKENRLHLPTWIWPECPQQRNSGVKKNVLTHQRSSYFSFFFHID